MSNTTTVTANTITAEMILELRLVSSKRRAPGHTVIWLASISAARFVDARPERGFRKAPTSVKICVDAYNAMLSASTK